MIVVKILMYLSYSCGFLLSFFVKKLIVKYKNAHLLLVLYFKFFYKISIKLSILSTNTVWWGGGSRKKNLIYNTVLTTRISNNTLQLVILVEILKQNFSASSEGSCKVEVKH
jgi:hypothetical protein